MFFPIMCFAPMEICWAVVICWVFCSVFFPGRKWRWAMRLFEVGIGLEKGAKVDILPRRRTAKINAK